jgi:hypothetical protein
MSVKIGKHFSPSEACPNAKGVPQGAVLSPLLFNLFISDISTILSDDIVIKQYADDIKAYVIYSKIKTDRTQKLQDFIDLFILWCNSLGLGLSFDKIRVLYFGSSNPNRPYLINGSQIETSNDCVRDLGFLFSPSLKWDTHINRKCRSAYHRWFNFFKFFKSTDSKLYVRIYKSYIRPVLEFGSIITHKYSVRTDNNIESVQRKITRMIYRRCHLCLTPELPNYIERCKTLNLETLSFRNYIADLTFFHYIILNPETIAKRNRPIPNTYLYSLKNKSRYKLPQVRSALRQKSFFLRTTREFNKLPNELQDSVDNHIFRIDLIKHSLNLKFSL